LSRGRHIIRPLTFASTSDKAKEKDKGKSKQQC